MNRKYLITTLVALTMAITLVPVSTQQAINEYDPWADMNDDGKIDIWDIGYIARKFGTNGEPVNKTALLYEVNATFTELLSEMMSLKARVDTLEAQIAVLETDVGALRIELAILNATKLGKPDFDSEWIPLAIGLNTIYFPEAIDPTNAIVYVVGKKSLSSPQHQIEFGGEADWPTYSGIYWHNLTESYIRVHRNGNDFRWNYIRIRIWEFPEP
jgi:hypothetical protein